MTFKLATKQIMLMVIRYNASAGTVALKWIISVKPKSSF